MSDAKPSSKPRAVTPPPTDRSAPKDPDKAPRGRGRPKGSGTRTANLESSLTEMVQMLSVPFALTGDAHCAGIIYNGAQPLAEAWTKLAKENTAVAKVLNGLVTGSAWSGVIVTTAGIALPIARHHGLGIPNLMSPGELIASQAMQHAPVQAPQPQPQPQAAPQPQAPMPVQPVAQPQPQAPQSVRTAPGPAAFSSEGGAGRMNNPRPAAGFGLNNQPEPGVQGPAHTATGGGAGYFPPPPPPDGGGMPPAATPRGGGEGSGFGSGAPGPAALGFPT